MTLYSSIAFALAMFVLAVTPGPGVFAVLSRALNDGFQKASLMIMGIVVGDVIYLLIAIFGLNFVIQSFTGLFVWLKVIGGLYLIWLAYTMWSVKKDDQNSTPKKITKDKTLSETLAGLLITLSNPKVILFYLGFLPTFVNLSQLSGADVLFITFIVIFVLSLSMLLYAFFASKAKQWLKNSQHINNINRFSAAVMFLVGLVLLAQAFMEFGGLFVS